MDQYIWAGGGFAAGLALGLCALFIKKSPHAVHSPLPLVVPKHAEKVKPSGEPLRLLALLQSESRLVDFLLEDIAGFDDAQVGQAVRDIHGKAKAVLKQHLILEPVVADAEGETTVVARGFDPSAIRVLGNVAGEPPYTGQVQHPGWRVKELKLHPPPKGADEFVIQPAEVQVG